MALGVFVCLCLKEKADIDWNVSLMFSVASAPLFKDARAVAAAQLDCKVLLWMAASKTT